MSIFAALINMQVSFRGDVVARDRASSYAFIGDLVRLLERDETLVLQIGNDLLVFDLANVRVTGPTEITFDEKTIDTAHIEGGEDGEYRIVRDHDGEPVKYEVRLSAAEKKQQGFAAFCAY